jgi:hypothetical protein
MEAAIGLGWKETKPYEWLCPDCARPVALESRPQSKFEWRPEDITILSKEEGDAAVAEFEEWQAEIAREVSGESTQPSPDRVISPE